MFLSISFNNFDLFNNDFLIKSQLFLQTNHNVFILKNCEDLFKEIVRIFFKCFVILSQSVVVSYKLNNDFLKLSKVHCSILNAFESQLKINLCFLWKFFFVNKNEILLIFFHELLIIIIKKYKILEVKSDVITIFC